MGFPESGGFGDSEGFEGLIIFGASEGSDGCEGSGREGLEAPGTRITGNFEELFGVRR